MKERSGFHLQSKCARRILLHMPGKTRSVLALLGFVAVALLIGALGATQAAPGIATWYAHLRKPPLTPPGAVFAPVWTVLYCLMGVSAWLAWRTRASSCRSSGLRMWAVQLVINFAWTGVFFRMHSPGAALFDLLLLILSVVLTMRPFYTIRPLAAWLLAPYLAWTVFALYLNVGVAVLNR